MPERALDLACRRSGKREGPRLSPYPPRFLLDLRCLSLGHHLLTLRFGNHWASKISWPRCEQRVLLSNQTPAWSYLRKPEPLVTQGLRCTQPAAKQ